MSLVVNITQAAFTLPWCVPRESVYSALTCQPRLLFFQPAVELNARPRFHASRTRLVCRKYPINPRKYRWMFTVVNWQHYRPGFHRILTWYSAAFSYILTSRSRRHNARLSHGGPETRIPIYHMLVDGKNTRLLHAGSRSECPSITKWLTVRMPVYHKVVNGQNARLLHGGRPSECRLSYGFSKVRMPV